ncbi:MAG TPA: aspartate aminotransferase family protein [Elusimicrobia bacterium]|nr:MAG: 4-aminobutyrate aminotransferase [Elusimicrobia bacterium GWA2_66_18]OGR69472.1 MAG: 4-aminobutyrate aminotransferase [Elusimicrobia bacterium GWC2_65_9]HAZ09168.1 aspartate aminotransferase family protein [Elusimicrobiota bacterium]
MTGYPSIVVPPPGPKAKRVIDKDAAYASPSYIKEYPLVMGGGKGAMVEDVDGNRYIDWMAGIAVSSAGHNHPAVVKAVQEAAGKFLHICGTDFYYEGFSDLCEKLAKSVKGKEKRRVFLTNSGTEAVEGAIKLARHHTKRHGLISFHSAFHGRSYAAMSLSSSKVKYRKNFGPLLPGVYHLPFHNPYRNALEDCVKAAHQLFETQISPEEIAAVIMEPLQGEGGYVLPSREFLRFWRALCSEYGIVLIYDEIQSGAGRTGKMWACDHYGVEPDVILTAKGIAGGMPVGAIIAKQSVMTWPRGSHGSTYGGNPVACAAALATIDLIESELAANASRMGERLLAGLKKLQKKRPVIGDVRGLGLFIGVELVKDRRTKEPDGEFMSKLEQLAFRKGLLLLGCGQSTIRVAPPLVLTAYDVDKGLEIFDACLADLAR